MTTLYLNLVVALFVVRILKKPWAPPTEAEQMGQILLMAIAS